MSNSLIPQDIFGRLNLVHTFNNNQTEIKDANISASLIDLYLPRVVTDFNIDWELPQDPLSVRLYRNCLKVPANHIPYFIVPPVDNYFPVSHSNKITQARFTSILPLLITAHKAKVDFRDYDIVSERNSLRKIAMNKEQYVIGVVRSGRTLLLRRYDNCRRINKGDVGYRFEQMCTTNYTEGVNYGHLIEGHIGSLKTLITAEVDAVTGQNKSSVELKCRQQVNDRHLHETWLQAFLSGTETVTIGYRSSDEPLQLVDAKNYRVSEMIDEQGQIKILQHLYQVLQFLQNHVQEGHSYLLRRLYNHTTSNMGLFLYEVVNENDKEYLAFIKPWMLKQLVVNN